MTAYRQRGCELKGKRVCKQRGCSKRSVRPQRSPQTSRRTTAAGRATDSVLRAASTRSRRAAHRSGAALAGQRSVPCALHCLKVGDPTGDARGLYNQSRWPRGSGVCPFTLFWIIRKERRAHGARQAQAPRKPKRQGPRQAKRRGILVNRATQPRRNSQEFQFIWSLS